MLTIPIRVVPSNIEPSYVGFADLAPVEVYS
jgi:hypothetical protein